MLTTCLPVDFASAIKNKLNLFSSCYNNQVIFKFCRVSVSWLSFFYFQNRVVPVIFMHGYAKLATLVMLIKHWRTNWKSKLSAFPLLQWMSISHSCPCPIMLLARYHGNYHGESLHMFIQKKVNWNGIKSIWLSRAFDDIIVLKQTRPGTFKIKISHTKSMSHGAKTPFFNEIFIPTHLFSL